jgi:hypothetical protein
MTGAAMITGGMVPGVVSSGGSGGTVVVPVPTAAFKAKVSFPSFKARMVVR